ncbi:MAG: hypothetical protein II143_07560, partial [Bacteroidales bacterium]|nr:hypothetical protein [Bacteroidales bacterium]
KDAFTAAEKNIQVTVTAKEGGDPTPGPTGAAIEIDGDFSDWASLPSGTFTKSVSDPDAPWEAVKEVRCYADPDFVYYYIQYDTETLEELLANPAESLPMRLNLNTDGEYTSGYTSYFLEAYDFMVEGHIADNGEFCSFDGGFYQRISGGWVNLLAENSGMCCGAGSGCEYEIRLDREMFNEAAKLSTVPMPMGDEFQTSLRFYTNGGGSWEELSNMPNSSIDEEAGNGYGYLMRIKTNK